MSSDASTVEMISDVLGHETEIAAGDLQPAWDAFTAELDESTDEASFLAAAIQLKALSMIALNRVRDYSDMSELVTLLTPSRATAILMRFDDVAGSSGDLPLGSMLVRRLGLVRPRRRAQLAGATGVPPDPTAEEWARTSADCIAIAALLTVGDAEPTTEAAEWTETTIAEAIDHGGLGSWRSIMAVIGDDPWCPVAQRLNAALANASDKGASTALREALLSVRHSVELDEQADVAQRVTDYIAATGMTQRAFAARVGTSPSRLSTYANGSVTPSAAMMLRIAKVSSRLATDPD